MWGEAEKAGVPIYVLVPQRLVHLIDKVAQRYPGLKLTMDHLSLSSSMKDAEAFRDLDLLLAIAQRANVSAKNGDRVRQLQKAIEQWVADR